MKAHEWSESEGRAACSLHELAVGLAALVAGAKVVLGMRNVSEVESNMAAVAKAHTVPRRLWLEAQRRGLLSQDLAL